MDPFPFSCKGSGLVLVVLAGSPTSQDVCSGHQKDRQPLTRGRSVLRVWEALEGMSGLGERGPGVLTAPHPGCGGGRGE